MHTDDGLLQPLHRYHSNSTAFRIVWIADWDTETGRWREPVYRPSTSNELDMEAAWSWQGAKEHDRRIAEVLSNGGGGPAAWFRCREGNEDTVAWLPQMVGPNLAILLSFTARGRNRLRDHGPTHPVLSRLLTLQGRAGNTLKHRTLCADLRLDPDFRRPEPLPRYAEMGEHLMRWIDRQVELPGEALCPQVEAVILVADMIRALTPEGQDCPRAILDLLGRLKQSASGTVPLREEFLAAFEGFGDRQTPAHRSRTVARFIPNTPALLGHFGKLVQHLASHR